MPDVLALPLAQAEVILKASGLQYQVRRIASGYRQKQTENCRLDVYKRQAQRGGGKRSHDRSGKKHTDHPINIVNCKSNFPM